MRVRVSFMVYETHVRASFMVCETHVRASLQCLILLFQSDAMNRVSTVFVNSSFIIRHSSFVISHS